MVKDKNNRSVLIVTPHLQGLGGVANYYKAILPYLKEGPFLINHLVVGTTKNKKKIIHRLTDQVNFHNKLPSGYELIHINPSLDPKSFIRDGLLLLQAEKKGIPVIVFFRGWDEKFAQLVDSNLLTLFRCVYGKADAFIVLASKFKNKLRSWGIKAPIYLQTTTVDHDLLDGFDIERKVQQLLEKKIRILYLARLEREKGIFETIDAVRILRERQIHVDLSIAGDGTTRIEVENYVQGIEVLRGFVKFLGYVRKQSKSDAFANHDIYCFPSYFGEGMPNSVLEALAFGMPVITCSVGGLADIFHDGTMGAFVPPQDPIAIADKIEKFILDREKMAATARYNFQYAKRFLAPNVADNLLNIYNKTLNKKK